MLDGRNWFGQKGATKDDLEKLHAAAPSDLPQLYVDLLAFSDGGEGPLPVDPYTLCLDSAKTVVRTIQGKNHEQADLDCFLIFGGNGGGEYIAFDLRSGTPWPIVTIDMLTGVSSAEIIAPDFDAFYRQIGIEAGSI